ncbi:pseudouridine synthase [Phormidium sp. CCY1219]|uniref:pseudouridine synthase n=1 Tax=Phormidium sp. CCY1219 TaxID=2886104 RepID=UPI002D1E60A7|nr:pseudouridine synthase [Phormidium sp. CCY1219]MEB3826353.1 rRNA pseudouridine synthase [Phormidium sp. CCY1219]
MDERVQKILSQWGIASRRQAEKMIQQGRVKLNGQPVHLGQKANPLLDRIEVDDRAIEPAHRPDLVYLLLHKPAGVVSTCSDPQGRTTVLHLLPPELRDSQGIHPVGRLDFDSTGALLLTNDGMLTFHLTHPKHCIPKTYRVWVEGHPPESILQQWRRGVMLDGRKTIPAQLRVLEAERKSKTRLEIVLKEGRNRQIRRVAAQLGYPVIQLHRTAIGSIELNPPGHPQLRCGEYRPLNDSEIRFLRTQVHLSSENLPATQIEEQGI